MRAQMPALRRRPIVALASLALGALASPARAHVPRFLDSSTASAATALALADPTISAAIYGRLERRALAGHVRFPATAGTSLLIEIDAPKASDPPRIPRRVVIVGPNGFTRTIAIPKKPFEQFHEDFTNTDNIRYLRRRVKVPVDGDYRLVVSGRRGYARVRFLLVIGDRERFSVEDVAGLPAALRRIRRWYETV